jgi:hypothetical protein
MKENNILDDATNIPVNENLLKREKKIFSISSLSLVLYNSLIISGFTHNMDFWNFITNATIIVLLSGVTGYMTGLLLAFIPFRNILYRIKYIPASLLAISILNLFAGIKITIDYLQYHSII